MDVLNDEAEVLRSRGAYTMSTPLLVQLNRHLRQIQTRFAESQSAAAAASSGMLDRTVEKEDFVDLRVFSPAEQRKFIDFNPVHLSPSKSSALKAQHVFSVKNPSQHALDLETIRIKLDEVDKEIQLLNAANRDHLGEDSIKVS